MFCFKVLCYLQFLENTNRTKSLLIFNNPILSAKTVTIFRWDRILLFNFTLPFYNVVVSIRLLQPRIQIFWKKVVLYVGHHGWSTKKILGFRWSKKAKITFWTISFWQNTSTSIFKFSPSFIYNESLPIKFYQVFKICKRFDKEREKILMQQSTRKEKLRKVGFCFITGCSIKSFNLIINDFFVSQAHSQSNFCFLVSGWRKKYQKGKRTVNS